MLQRLHQAGRSRAPRGLRLLGSSAVGGPTRADFAYWLPIQTRWRDNDMYGHMNNVEYYALFDTVVNHFLIEQAHMPVGREASIVGFCVNSSCDYLRPVAYPSLLSAGMSVSALGNSSVRYTCSVFDGEEAAAVGTFTHVFVDIETQKPVPIPEYLRTALATVEVPASNFNT